MANAIIHRDFEQTAIPLGIKSLVEFRRWALSDKFPENGRIDWIRGNIEVDMAPEEFFAHGVAKVAVSSTLHLRAMRMRLGYVVSDSSRVTCPAADLSAEPDVVFVSREAIATGRVQLIPKAGTEGERYVEIEGPPELVVEIISDSSVKKDTDRLPASYFDAGVDEYWLIDARGDELSFQVFTRGPDAFETGMADESGFRFSNVFQVRYRMDRQKDDDGFWIYELVEDED
jgi:Uma2 family endonuclease